MHSEYLRRLFLNNDLTEGHYYVDGRPVLINEIRPPIFAVGTEKDHVAPWRSVYKWNLFADTEVTFLLTNGGHNAGIVSEPGHHHRHYQMATRQDHDSYVDPDLWASQTPTEEGSWWPAWAAWLAERSSKERVAPPPLGAPEKGYEPLCDAPGQYVFGE
jgi:polyhydroxyalkanoate synthase